MERLKPFAVATMLAMSSTLALGQQPTPPTTEQTKQPGTNSPAPPPTPAAAPVGEQTTAPARPETQAGASTAEQAADSTGTIEQSPGDIATSKLVGASVYNANNENIGEIEDLIISSNGTISTVVVGVGGFLGIGEKKVGMPFSALKTERGDNNAMKVVVEGSKESLKAMPDYAYAAKS